MLSPEYNSQPESENLRVWTLKVTYKPELAQGLETALIFLTDKLGYPTDLPADFLKTGGQVQFRNQDETELKIIIEESNPGNGLDNITFHTDDCLRDYHRYLMSGIEFINRPEYHPMGLLVHFIGPKETIYTLLETRIYTEH